MPTITKHGFDYQGGFTEPKHPLVALDPKVPKKLWAHQMRFLAELKDEFYWFVVGPPAAGKSLTIAALITEKLRKDPHLRAIIVVPQTIIGNGFEDSKFELPGGEEIHFDPHTKLHKPDLTEGSNRKALKRFLKKRRVFKDQRHHNSRVVICTHQSFVQAYKRFPELFTDVLVVVDEAHHSKAADVGDEIIANCLGAAVVDLVDRGQQVGLATATASRGDGCGLMGAHADKFKVSECPFDEYLKVCQYFESFSFDFVLYDGDYVEAIDQLLGDKRKRIPHTLVHIPSVHGSISLGKYVDVDYVYAGIAGAYEYEVENPDGDGDGISIVMRGRHPIRVVDLVNEENRELKKAVIAAAHDDPENTRIDVVIALDMFKEGANWRWIEKSIIMGYRGSFTELTQIVGRGLRDAPEKYSTSIHYLLPRREHEPDDDQASALNDYLKALLFVLLLEDEFRPVTIRVKDSKGKQRTVKIDLLAEAVGYDASKKLRIERAVIAELLTHNKLSTQGAVKVVVEALEREGVEHPSLPLSAIARQLVATHQRRSRSVLQRLGEDVTRFGVGEVDIKLIQKANHPLAYLQYYTESIGVGTLGALRKALCVRGETRWWFMYRLLTAFVAEHGHVIEHGKTHQGENLGSWVSVQRRAYRGSGAWTITEDHTQALEQIPGWSWDVLGDRWQRKCDKVKTWVQEHGGNLPIKDNRQAEEKSLGLWCSTQKMNYHAGKLTEERTEKMESIPGWSWGTLDDRWLGWWGEVDTWMRQWHKMPAKDSKDEEEARLGRWRRNQCYSYSKGKLSAYRIKRLEAIPGWSWGPQLEKWEANFTVLVKWMADHHHTMPSKETGQSATETRLGIWVCGQLYRYKHGTLAPTQKEKLESIPGWTWNRLHTAWQTKYEGVKAWVERTGAFPTFARGATAEEGSLATWCHNQRAHRSDLSQEKIKILESIPGWVWHVREDRWMTKWSKVKQWRETHHEFPSKGGKHSDGAALSSWCTDQRKRYRHGKLSADRVKLLESILGWAWDVNKQKWDYALDFAIMWEAAEDRTPRVSSTDAEERSVASWYGTQRATYHAGKLSADRIKRLEGMSNWTWDTEESRWAQNFSTLVQFVKTEQRLPPFCRNDRGVRLLGTWCSEQRQHYRKGALSPDRAKKLESIPGWWWWTKEGTTKPRYATAKKVRARNDTVINFYREMFRRKKLPADQQYWSMCATCVNTDGEPLPNSELHQVLKAGLIQPHQFHGVDRDEAVWETNYQYPYANWYCEDFYDALEAEAVNPGIVNVDTVSEPPRGVDLFCRVLELLRDTPDILFAGNFILTNRNRRYTLEDVVDLINANPRFQELSSTLKWDPESKLYWYRGATRANATKMCTVLMWRKGKTP